MYLLHRLIIFAVELLSESVVGQTEKNSVRAYVFGYALELGHCSMQSACLKRAISGSDTGVIRLSCQRAPAQPREP
jgi:hypothetical protein